MSESSGERPTFILSARIINAAAAALLGLMAVFLFASMRQESQIMDESDHLFAGVEYWKHADFGRNPEHPPLVKLLAALPILPVGPKEPPPVPIPYFKGQDFVNSAQYLYAGDADRLLLRGRLVVIFFSLALGLLIFFCAREMFDPITALFALGLFAFEPTLLANGAIITTDVPLACLFFAAVYAFYRYLLKPTPLRLALCAAGVALTLTAKHSGILILPVLALLAIVDLWFSSQRDEPQSRTWFTSTRVRQLAMAFLVIAAFSYLFVWAIYGFRYAARPGQLQLIPTLAAYSVGLTHPIERSWIAFCASHHLLPEAYLFGWVDILLIPGVRTTFLFGHVFAHGQWFFFPAMFLVKTTLAVLVLLCVLPFARIRHHRREFLFLILPPAFYLLVSVLSMLNMGVRHILPAYPFCIVLAGAAAAAFAARSAPLRAVVAALLLFNVASSLHGFPDYLAYSNELVGGPSHTYRVVADSNADWGQGLKWTSAYLKANPTQDCWFDYANPTVDPAYYGVRCKPLLSGFGHIVGMGVGPLPEIISGTILLSATDESGLLWGPGTLNPYQAFSHIQPDARIGNVILVYHGTFNLPLLAAQSNAVAAVSLLQTQQVPQALALASTAVRQAPDSAEVNAVLGQVLLAGGHVADARQANATALHLAETQYPEYQTGLIHRIEATVAADPAPSSTPAPAPAAVKPVALDGTSAPRTARQNLRGR